MRSELKDNAEARTVRPTGTEAVSLMPSQQDLAAFWQNLKLAGSTTSREQEMFSQGYTFGNLESLYGGSGTGIGADNYLTEKGTIGKVGLMGTSPMSELKAKDQGDRQAGQQPDKATLTTPEGQQVRNACGEQVEAIKAANPNVSDGSVKNWAMMTQAEKFAHVEKTGQDRSLELVDHEPSGKEVVIAARQMFAGVETKSASQAPVQELSDVDNRPIKDYGWQAKQHGKDKVIETGLEYQAGKKPEITAQGLFEKIGALPLDQQAQVIGAGIKAYSGELSHQQFRIGVGAITGLGDGIVGLAQGAESLGKAVIGVAQFSRDVMANDPSALETAGKAGESLGKLLVGGIRVYSAAEGYLESVGAATNVGDYGKALRDVAWLGQQINSRWESMSPEEKTKLVTKLSVENLGGLAVGFGADKLAKSVKITEALEALGAEASQLGEGPRNKAGKLISRMLDELTPRPKELFMPEVPKELRHLELSKAEPELISAMQAKGRTIEVAKPGSFHYSRLQRHELAGSAMNDDIFLIENGPKIAALEEFLHGTQRKLPTLAKIEDVILEIDVKDFMVRHRKLLGLSNNDVKVLEALKEGEIEKAAQKGLRWIR